MHPDVDIHTYKHIHTCIHYIHCIKDIHKHLLTFTTCRCIIKLQHITLQYSNMSNHIFGLTSKGSYSGGCVIQFGCRAPHLNFRFHQPQIRHGCFDLADKNYVEASVTIDWNQHRNLKQSNPDCGLHLLFLPRIYLAPLCNDQTSISGNEQLQVKNSHKVTRTV